MTYEDRPTPRHAVTPAEFVAAMLRLKSWAGMSYRQLERQAAKAGETLPRTTVTAALSRNRVPQEHLVTAFARACGCGDEEIREWIAARRRVAVAVMTPAHTPAEPARPEQARPEQARPEPGPAREDALAPGSAREDDLAPGSAREDDLAPGSVRDDDLAPGGGDGSVPVERGERGSGREGRPVNGVGVVEQHAVVGSARPVGLSVAVPLGGPRRGRRVTELCIAALLAAFVVSLAWDGRLGRWLQEPKAQGKAPSKANPSPDVLPREPSLQIPPPTERQLRKPPAAPAGAPTVLYVGDSIVTETSSTLAYFVHTSGKGKVVSVARKRAALCDYLAAGRSDSLSGLVERTKPRVVVLQFWGHSSTANGCTGAGGPGGEEYYQRYLSSARQAVRQIAGAAARSGIARPRVVWVLQGPDRARPERVRRLNEEIYQVVADDNGDLVSDAGQEISLAANVYELVRDGRYRWTAYLPCGESEWRYGLCTHPKAFGGVTQLHPDHDARQLCRTTSTVLDRCTVRSPGVVRYTRVIARTVLQALLQPG